MAVKGVDISEMNGEVNFSALKTSGVNFVIIRLGYGSDYSNQDDKRFEENVKKAEVAGIPWGAYLYSYATNTTMAKSEAKHSLRLLNGRKPAYGMWYDVEDPQIANADLVSICEAYCEAMEAEGVYCGIYSMLAWMNNKLSNSRLDKYDKWVAQWANQCSYKKAYGMWQYTDKWVIGGKLFDGDIAYKDYPLITPPDTLEDDEDLTYDQWKDYMEKYESETAALPVSNWATQAVNFVKSKGIMNGDMDGKFRAQSPITREEVAAVVKNIADK